ncbi:permease [Sinomicrobium sp. M5D2P9]
MAFALFILTGILLKQKFQSPGEINGLKKIILNLALPAMIFVALIQVKIDTALLLSPVFAIAFNFALFYVTPFLLRFIGIRNRSRIGRTARILLPSLAPGLSCFPFISEFLGDIFLAKAAMADLGNKIFVLVILYIIAMQWYYQNNPGEVKTRASRIRELLLVLVKEPVNMVIAFALLFIGIGISLDQFPFFLRDVITRLSVIMTPLVLLFIGLAVKVKKEQFRIILSLLLMRAGIALLLVGIGTALLNIVLKENILFAVAFTLSACSFWPFVHISGVGSIELRNAGGEKTFDSDFALAILAFSLPLSTVLVLGLLSAGAYFSSPLHLITLAILLFGAGILPTLIKKLKYFGKLPSPLLQKFVPEEQKS